MDKSNYNTKILMDSLIDCNFAIYKSKSKTWKFISIGENENYKLCIMVRKGGIDYKLFDKNKYDGIVIKNNIASVNGGDIYRNYYLKAQAPIIRKTIKIARSFRINILISDIYKTEGHSNKCYPDYEKVRYKLFMQYKEKRQLEYERRRQAENDAIAMKYGWVS